MDDEPDSVAPIIILFEHEGYNVKYIDTHSGIFNAIAEFAPDLILLDIFLKGSDGRYICNLLKSINKTKSIPIVLISGIIDAQQVLQNGIESDGFLRKPFELEESIERVKNLMS